MHIMTWDTGTKVGGLSPTVIPSFSRSLKFNKNELRSIHTSEVQSDFPHTVFSLQSTCYKPHFF